MANRNAEPGLFTGVYPNAAPMPATNSSFEFHKNIFRSAKFDDATRKQSAQWLLDHGIQFDEGKFIDPERLPS